MTFPTPADFDGDGYLDFAVWRPSEATFHIQYNTRRQGVDGAKSARMLGQPGDIPVPGNYRNDIYGRAGVAVYRPSTSVWYLTAPPCVGCDSSTLLSPRVGAPRRRSCARRLRRRRDTGPCDVPSKRG